MICVVLPCLNEAASVRTCISNVRIAISESRGHAEVIVADNGSTDASNEEALAAGAKVVDICARGYGSAIRGGLDFASGDYFIIGGPDNSYDFQQIQRMIGLLQAGYDLVVGNRFAGNIEESAMPWLNRYIGNPTLSGVGRWLYKTSIRDFHCGLRGIRADAYRKLNLQSDGMEFASEMVIKASLAGMRTAEFPTTLCPRAKGSRSHLGPWRDGLRHLGLLLRCRMQSKTVPARAPLHQLP